MKTSCWGETDLALFKQFWPFLGISSASELLGRETAVDDYGDVFLCQPQSTRSAQKQLDSQHAEGIISDLSKVIYCVYLFLEYNKCDQ